MSRMNKYERKPPFSIGGISILMVFVMLCLTTFGVLTLVTARAEMRLTEKNAQSVSSYYAAVSRSQEILAQIDGILKDGEAQGRTDGEIADEISRIEGANIEKQGTVRIVQISVRGEGVIGMQLTVTINENNKITAADSIMTSNTDFNYGSVAEDLWQGN